MLYLYLALDLVEKLKSPNKSQTYQKITGKKFFDHQTVTKETYDYFRPHLPLALYRGTQLGTINTELVFVDERKIYIFFI